MLRRTPLKRSPIKRKPRKPGDSVTPDLHQRVLVRDDFRCMAPILDKELDSPCRDNWGNPLTFPRPWDSSKLELDHVKEAGQQAMGDRAKSDERHLVAICPYHHKHSGWATSVRGRTFEREYLASKYPDELST